MTPFRLEKFFEVGKKVLINVGSVGHNKEATKSSAIKEVILTSSINLKPRGYKRHKGDLLRRGERYL